MTSALCRYFAACDNVTTTGLTVPTLGLVPTCERCARRVDQAAQLVPLTEGVAIASFIPAAVCPCGGTRVEITLARGICCADCGQEV